VNNKKPNYDEEIVPVRSSEKIWKKITLPESLYDINKKNLNKKSD